MAHYIMVSMAIGRIYERYSDLVEIFSIDESWIDCTQTLHLFGGDTETLARIIQNTVQRETGIRIRIGIGSNKCTSKAANSLWAKKNESGIFTLRDQDIPSLYWPRPIEDMFGIGSRMLRHCRRLGLHTIGDLARTPLDKLKQRFRAHFGRQSDIQAEVLWRIANGRDNSPVSPGTFDAAPKSIGHMMTLPTDFDGMAAETVLRELSEEVSRDCRRKGLIGQIVSVGCTCSPFEAPSGFSRQLRMPEPTAGSREITETARALFRKHWNGMPVRRIGVTLSGLTSDEGYQLALFEDRPKMRALDQAMDEIKDRFGSAAILRASSLTSAGQALYRSQRIGGHSK